MASKKESRGIGGFAYFIVGVLLGVVLTGFIVTFAMPRMMINVSKSNRDFERTVAVIEAEAQRQGWKVPKVYDLRKSIAEAGYTDMSRMHILSICQPDHAHDILVDDVRKRITALMPCRIAVYEDSAGQVYVAGMNVGLMSRLFGGVIQKVMGKVSKEEHEILRPILGAPQA